MLGFSFGWGYFQAFAMKDMAGGDYAKSLKMTFLPEFWFIMSMALLAGFITAYPMNWWMVSNHMKHGMITVLSREREPAPTAAMAPAHMADMESGGMEMPEAARSLKIRMIVVSVAVLAVTLWLVTTYAPMA